MNTSTLILGIAGSILLATLALVAALKCWRWLTLSRQMRGHGTQHEHVVTPDTEWRRFHA